MPPESPFERELLDRLTAESPVQRAVRRAYERWVASIRLWAMLDRQGLGDNVSRLGAAALALWPTMPAAHRDELLAAARRDPELAMRRPECFEDVMDERMAALLREHGFSEWPDRQDARIEA